MIDLRPFRALHYDPTAAGALADVIAPPYDVIDEAELARLYARSPHNVVRLILNRSDDRYAAAAADLAAWRRDGVLVQDREPSLYYYVQDFALPDGSQHRRSGVMAAVRLEPFAAGNILPHERTFASAKADRLKLMTACRTNLSPIFGVFPDPADALAPARAYADATPAWIDVADGGQRHRVWRLTDPAVVAAVVANVHPVTVFIADGHHRYETALTYRDQRRAAGDTDPDAPHNFMLMYLCSMEDPGLVVLPTHRVWRGALPADWAARVAEHFESEAVTDGAVFAALARETRPGSLGLHVTGRTQLLHLLERDMGAVDRLLADVHPVIRHLDPSVLDGFLLGEVLGIDTARSGQEGLLTYTHDDRAALEAVDRGGAAAAFLLRAPRMREVEAACLAGQTMPQKSTYFFPKLETGLVFHLLDADA
ncbi:MAG: DUF1015 domain-containing protein [Candidatus Binatia bacterium]